MKKICLVVVLLIGLTCANPLINQIPGLNDLDLNLPIGVGNLTQEGIENAFKDKCKTLTNDDNYFDKILEAKTKFENCTKPLMNFTGIQDEIEEKKKTGALDEVFGKQCKKIPTIKNCIKDFYQTVKPCLTESEQDHIKILETIFDSMYEFLCYKDGDRIALFIAEGGVECIQGKTSEIQNCAKEIKDKVGDDQPKTKEKFCSSANDLQTCVVRELEKCKEPTPANMIDALFKYMKKVAKCPKP